VSTVLYSLLALISLAPSIAVSTRRSPERDRLFWVTTVIAAVGPAAWCAAQIPQTWDPSLSAALWACVAAGMIVFAGVAAINDQAWRLSVLLVPYLLILGLMGWAAAAIPASTSVEPAAAWFRIHIAVAILTLGLLTVAAVGSLASYIQATGLKAKRRGWLSARLPAASESERLSANILIIVEIVLAIGVVSGSILEHAETGRFLLATHKTMMVLLAFVIIALLLIARRFLGMPGQVAARVVLLAYLLVVLGYFGVKVVHQMPMI
jgi:ABC-type uncharacterized transport system permease subunit